ncbi:hypothetical protein CMALT430_260009 [Carnobacterium maltaromaticum]|nr:hypothetical protein CMALT430_260009 [Carnobacterium maltaromaticum]
MHLTTILSFYNLAKLLNFVVWKVHFLGFCQTQIQKKWTLIAKQWNPNLLKQKED